MDLLSTSPHPALHIKGPDITWRQFMCTLLGQKDDILLTNLRNLISEKVGSVQRMEALENLGFLENQPIAKQTTPLDTITEYLAKKLAFEQNEKDIIILRHEIKIEWPNGQKENRSINLVVYGEAGGYSAMAKCVGYPAAIATKMVLEGEIQRKGMVMPITPEIYIPMLKRIENEGIIAKETSTKI
jgi:lysine-ketoglutarate reductase/saccharopine dehydrogenase